MSTPVLDAIEEAIHAAESDIEELQESVAYQAQSLAILGRDMADLGKRDKWPKITADIKGRAERLAEMAPAIQRALDRKKQLVAALDVLRAMPEFTPQAPEGIGA
jgi:septation ring formation regulator EzrA